MKIQSKLFLKEALLFGSTLALGLITAYQYLRLLPTLGAQVIQTSSLTTSDIVGFVVIIVAVWLISRIPRIGGWMFWIFLSLIILSGSQIVIAVFTPFPADVIGSLVLLILFLFVRNVFIHDLAIIIAIAGIGAPIGIMITPSLAVLLLILLSFYDIIAVYKTKHMVQMARTMISSGAIFGFIIPSSWSGFFTPRHEAQARVGSDFMILGSGDIGLPVIFASSLMYHSVPEAIIVAVFAMLGLLATHILFISQKNRQPMAALPPIATACLVGYVIALLIV